VDTKGCCCCGNVIEERYAQHGIPIPTEHTIDRFGELSAAGLVDAKRVHPTVFGFRIVMARVSRGVDEAEKLGPGFLLLEFRDGKGRNVPVGDFIIAPSMGKDEIVRDVRIEELLKSEGFEIEEPHGCGTCRI
jgi:hypothetical protein